MRKKIEDKLTKMFDQLELSDIRNTLEKFQLMTISSVILLDSVLIYKALN